MISKEYFNLDIDSTDIKSDLGNILLSDNYTFLLQWTKGEEIVLLGCAIEINSKFYSLITQPISDYDGTIAIPVGGHQAVNFKIHFRIYNPSTTQKIPKAKVFLINSTKNKLIKTTPSGNKTKELKPKALWQSKL